MRACARSHLWHAPCIKAHVKSDLSKSQEGREDRRRCCGVHGIASWTLRDQKHANRGRFTALRRWQIKLSLLVLSMDLAERCCSNAARHALLYSWAGPVERPACQRGPEVPAMWGVGTRIGAALRFAYERAPASDGDNGVGRHVRPHVRRAHWHTYVLGSRSDLAAQRRELRWLPPIPIAVVDFDSMPAVVHPVQP